MKRFHGSICKSSLSSILVANKTHVRTGGEHREFIPRSKTWSVASHSSEPSIKFNLDAVARPPATIERTRNGTVASLQSFLLSGIEGQKLEPRAWRNERRSLSHRTSSCYHSAQMRCGHDGGIHSGSGERRETNGHALAYTPDGAPPDAIMILAGGQTPSGGVPIWVERRLEAALAVYHAHGGKVPIVCMGAGTPHRRPIFADTGHVLHEGSSLAQYLLDRGVPPSNILKEWGSYDTVANAFFALVWHALPRRWANVMVVTSDFHMPRSRLLFEWVFGLEGASLPRATLPPVGAAEGPPGNAATQARCPADNGFSLHFISASDEGIDPSIINARRGKEAKSLENVKRLMKRIRTLPEFHAWFHIEHKAYNVADQHDFGREIVKDPALSSY